MEELITKRMAIDTFKDCAENGVGIDGIDDALESLSPAQPEIIRCKDCKHFEYDHVANINGITLIVAHEICTRWGDGVKTSENGYCFLAERREVTT